MNRTAYLAAALLLTSFASSASVGIYTADELKKTYIPELLTAESGIKGAEAPASATEDRGFSVQCHALAVSCFFLLQGISFS